MTPLMIQYFEIKNQYKDCILFYRLGDFYEMFYEDAIVASRELEITLTGKDCGEPERAPMCGVPYHAAEGYLTKLVNKGYRVAICEQAEDPKQAKGLVKREVVRIVTPGTNMNTQSLDETRNNYLMCIIYSGTNYGISVVDVTTGDFYVTETDQLSKAEDEMIKFAPKEILCNPVFLMSGFNMDEVKERYHVVVTVLSDDMYDLNACEKALYEHFHVNNNVALGLSEYSSGLCAAGSIMQYLTETQKNSLIHITRIIPYVSGRYMTIDNSTRRNLELIETMREKQKRGSLLWVLDKTKTAMGARYLRSCIEQPLIDKKEIEQRLDAIEELNDNAINREEIREYLNAVYDLERLMSRVSYQSANPRDLTAFKTSLAMLPHIRFLLSCMTSELLRSVYNEIDPLEDLHNLIEAAIEDEPPIAVREGGIIKQGYYEEVDILRAAKTEGKSWLMALEEREKERTGIKNLRIRYNRVFGYYLEVTNSFKELVPMDWVRKQTLTNAERYTTAELKELEDKILNAEDRLYTLEYDLFADVREKIASQVQRIQQTAKAIAKIDMFASLSYVAMSNRFIRPSINKKGVINIKNGRHPVVEKIQNHDLFVANDTYLDNQAQRIAIITGPNMAGKSTYMRQTALIVLMAQIGSFVPADEADIGIVDRIFTRVGASDDLASGQSTFMVEMNEVANILKNATKNSLLILDEIGRGTSTYDGLSIAWAVVEHIANPKILGAKTLFATHYHELTELEGKLESVNNYCIAVKEQGEDIVFLRKIIPGGADKSYGIQVARLAGVPEAVLKRAREIADELSENDIAERAGRVQKAVEQVRRDAIPEQLSLFTEAQEQISKRVLDELQSLDLSNMTPMEAFTKLYDLQMKLS